MEDFKFEVLKKEEIKTCELHGEFTDIGRSFTGNKWGWSGCPQCREIKRLEDEATEAEFKKREQQAALERDLNRSAIPYRFRDKTFANYVADTDEKKKALAMAQGFADEFEQHFQSGTTVIMSGKPGTGKTHLAIAAAMQNFQKHSALYINALDAIRMVRDTWRRDSEESETDVLKRLGTVHLLIIDEVGVQYGTEGEQVIMFDIINRRYRDSMPTILLTNLGKDQFKAYLGDRSFDRLREEGIWIPFTWESHRGQRAA